jgi:hypothetical protein
MISSVEINKLNDIREKINSCHHYWLIDRANGPESHAVCKYCNEERTFSNLPPQYQDQKTTGEISKQGVRSRSFGTYELFEPRRQPSAGRREALNRSN